MNTTLWVLQGLLAAAFLGAGAMKLFTPHEKLAANPQMGWASEFTDAQVKLLGLAEVLGAIGLFAPQWTGILPILTSVAAGALVVLMVGAVATHVRRKEPPYGPVVFAVLLIAVAVGRAL